MGVGGWVGWPAGLIQFLSWVQALSTVTTPCVFLTFPVTVAFCPSLPVCTSSIDTEGHRQHSLNLAKPFEKQQRGSTREVKAGSTSQSQTTPIYYSIWIGTVEGSRREPRRHASMGTPKRYNPIPPYHYSDLLTIDTQGVVTVEPAFHPSPPRNPAHFCVLSQTVLHCQSSSWGTCGPNCRARPRRLCAPRHCGRA